MALKWTLAWACLSLATAEEDAACMLQAHRAVEDTKPFCPAGTKSTFDFLKKKHGDIIKPNSIPKVTITVTPRKNPSSCTGPAMILDTRGPPGANPTPDGDLATCPDCAMLIYSQDGNTNNVNDCGEQSGPRFRFDFLKLEDLETILLWDLDEGTTRIRLYNDNGNMIGNILVPNTANGAGITVNLLTKNVRRMDVLLGGSGGIVSLTGCKQVGGSIFGDPHIYTLDGGKFDLYENGTFSVFHLTGLEPHVPKTAAGPHKGSVDWQLYAHYGGRAGVFSPHLLWGSSCLDALSPAMHGYSSVAQTFGRRSCSLQNRALVRDILKKAVFSFSIKKIRDFAFKVVLLEGFVSELVAPLIFSTFAVRLFAPYP